MKKPYVNFSKPSQKQLNTLLENYRAGRYVDTEKLSLLIIHEFPEYQFVWKVLAVVLKRTGRLSESLDASQKSVQLDPEDSEAHYNLGIILIALGRLKEAETSYRKAITLKDDYVEAHNNLGITLKTLGRLNEAEKSYKKAITLKDNYAEAHFNLGNLQKVLERLNEAEKSYKKAITLKDNYAEAHNNLGVLLQDLGRLEEAIICYDKAIEFNVDFSEAYNNKNCCINYSSLWSPLSIYKEHLKFEKQFGGLKAELPPSKHVKKNFGERLRIGYVSADLREHSVAYFFEPLLKNHNDNLVETFCYYNNEVVDATTKRLMAASDHWRSIVEVPDLDVFNFIKNDKIDILVDLSGHTRKNRLLVFVRKPAPIQVNWLGYVNTSGISSIDYRFTDIIADPIGEADKLHSETLWRLPNGFQCYQGNEKVVAGLELPHERKGHITFGSFNHPQKLTQLVIKTWSKILHAVPKSHLLLKGFQLNLNKAYYLEFFKKEGIAEDRIKIYGRLPAKDDHLNLYNKIDIGLDTFPFNGGTTTCEALWMGVPVITHIGDSFVGRLSASILSNVGLVDFIAQDIEAYIQIAVKMAFNTNYLKELRKVLRERMKGASLCDGHSVAKDVENAYQDMWQKY